jgi:predicted transcriptional regulator
MQKPYSRRVAPIDPSAQRAKSDPNSILPGLVGDIVSAYVGCGRNHIASADVAVLIMSVGAALQKCMSSPVTAESPKKPAEPQERPKPAVSPSRSVTDTHIICLEDGKAFKSLKRHLAQSYNMTPTDYRIRWNLPNDYPMVAPAYAKRRSEIAKQAGFGGYRKRAIAAAASFSKRGEGARGGNS